MDSFVAAICSKLRPLPPDPLAFAHHRRVLPVLSKGGVRIDIVLAAIPVEHEIIRRAVPRSIGGVHAMVARVDDLVCMKLISEREKDRNDAVRLLRRHRASLPLDELGARIAELAEALSMPDILDVFHRETAEPL